MSTKYSTLEPHKSNLYQRIPSYPFEPPYARGDMIEIKFTPDEEGEFELLPYEHTDLVQRID